MNLSSFAYPFWVDNLFGFITSKDYLEVGFEQEPKQYTIKQLSQAGVHIKHEPVQKGYPVNIGEKYRLEFQGDEHDTTVVGIAHGHYILVLDTPLNEDKKHLGGFVFYKPRWNGIEAVREGKWKKIEEWKRAISSYYSVPIPAPMGLVCYCFSLRRR